MIDFRKILMGTLVLLFILIAYVMIGIGHDKNTNPIVMYLEDKFHHPKRDFIKQAFAHIPNAISGQITLVLGATTAEQDTLLPLEKGYNLIALDERMIYYEYMCPDSRKYKDKVTILTEWNLEKLPKADIVMASFILPFYEAEDFKTTWNILNQKIKIGGYFIGNFFDPKTTIFKGESRLGMTYHTHQEVLMLFKNYKILKLDVIKKDSTLSIGLEYYYDVFAQKIR